MINATFNFTVRSLWNAHWFTMRRGMFVVVWNFYTRTLDSRPLVTQAATTGFVCGLGDVIAQTFIEGKKLHQYDLPRTARMTAIGLLFTGPVLRGWFLTLDKGFGRTRGVTDALKKVFFDQIIFAPILTAILLSVFGFSQRMDRSQVKEKLRAEYFNLLVGFYKLWPAAQLINFYFVPLKFRVNYTNIVSLGWNSYVGYVANRPVNKQTDNTSR